MDKSLANQLDNYIHKLQEVSRQLKGSRSASFLRTEHSGAAIARGSAREFLAYCALISLLRRNIGPISEPSCVALIAVPNHWRLADVNEAVKIIFKDEKVRYLMHPTTQRRGSWEVDATDYLKSGKLIVFFNEGSPIHEDFELAATMRDRLKLCDIRHLQALGRLRGCGNITDDQAAIIATQPSERMEAIFRIGQPVRRIAVRLAEENYQRSGSNDTKQLDVSKGFGEASVWAQELKTDIHEWRDGKLPWSEVDKGCLLYGPPGTGKTRFAAALAAECGMHLEATSIAKWQSSKEGHLGDMLKAMYRAFGAAKEQAPCLLFIDEFDSIGDRAKFPSRHADYSTNVVNALLECLDGTESREGVIVVGACNFPEKIDPALIRSGRLEKHVYFPMPDVNARAEILAFHLPSLAEDPALNKIAARLPGKSGADLERLAREARRVARRERRPITIDDIRSKIVPLPELNFEHLLRIATHEAGHALVAHMLKVGRVERVEIFDNIVTFSTELDAHGITVIELPERPFWTRWEMMKMITFHLAGAAAEEVFFKDTSTMASGSKDSDFAKATSLAVKMVTEHGFGSSRYYLPGSVDASSPLDLWQDQRLEAEVNEILETQYDRAFDMLSGLETSLVQFAVKLAEMKTLQGNDLKMLWPGADILDGKEARRC
ncbi:AAA family ATPase [Agrobacterium sp. ICMP 7243]|uniref:AAA family ATPase n=2 Tax=Rhizobium rhizogenes TaxID=359 RepID=UPI0006469BCA|nr:AAA family ATPase [Rhizobium rhizogenes]KAA6489926.1 AAA family ATPase [Agrobacterium sp. ICMP 7243]